MRLILARVLFAFDIELDKSCRNWVTDQTSWVTWARLPLYVRLTRVNQAGK
ncbi:hypothetical protein QBC46DRAFT_128370 [Diplogelasinospora grovesii]|uniref:Uncharacterized protein n=1 Tax=Diplogelasinospora grovesii TaxID=303347 RepID=A0AAN6MUB5_9PEZI|nr:hypothetical protein QBC46DRAFT_128370 [Diplogelasinospora grovesii]